MNPGDLGMLFSAGTLGTESDGHLLELFVTQRDDDALSALIERHGPMVHRVCRQVPGNPHDAQDAFSRMVNPQALSVSRHGR